MSAIPCFSGLSCSGHLISTASVFSGVFYLKSMPGKNIFQNQERKKKRKQRVFITYNFLFKATEPDDEVSVKYRGR